MLKSLKNMLSIPETAGLDLDDPALTVKRRELIQNKGFLHRLYNEWYELLAATVPSGPGEVLEIGSGGGFMSEFIPGLMKSDVFHCTGVDLVMDACGRWPFGKNQLKAVLLVDVLHHLPDVHRFFREVQTVLRNDGVIAMIEPWVTPWSVFVYSHLHHEPFFPETPQWRFPSKGPLSGANSALPWIIFHRDKQKFQNTYPDLRIDAIEPMLPFSYILSGGVSMRSLLPANLYSLCRKIERLSTLERRCAMFAFICLKKI